ncbi:hypothetical protein T4D_5796 [Trichinella pseudospiralis]|uniref:Transmembrane protein n=1 Tax=Trichinella pseudospiralis TaxID=6337 RepID=A0A0V1FX87_TRIPS|nr:hypothetical protein T4D_5796 [Trichinella pseudospiralis]
MRVLVYHHHHHHRHDHHSISQKSSSSSVPTAKFRRWSIWLFAYVVASSSVAWWKFSSRNVQHN